jgi:putative PIN family toxin of toxin-antitoxin system
MEAKQLGRKLVAVIDTNLFISGLFGRNSTTAQLQELWIRQEFQLGTSLAIMKEVNRVLQYPRIKVHLFDEDETVRRFFRLVFRKAVVAKDDFQTDRIVDDPTDNKFLACALRVNTGTPYQLFSENWYGVPVFLRQITSFQEIITSYPSNIFTERRLSMPRLLSKR